MGLGASPRCGDWVKATATIPMTWSDCLSSTSGVQPGTHGVVVSGPDGWISPTVTVLFDTGLGGSCEVVTPIDKIRVSRRAGGVEQFRGRTHWKGLFRLGVALALIAPLVYFIGMYLWVFRTFDGLVQAVVTAALDSAAAAVEFAFTHPVEALIFFAVSWLLGRFAFR